ncbi:MAG: YitT family protein [Ruminococcaceae bacterium]|nr:YitT family protein [Oscillospiraceae bacterium]
MKAEKIKLKRVLSVMTQYFLCILGSFLYALAVSFFVTPLKFAAGGVTGLGILVNYAFPVISTGMFVFAANVPLFLISWKKFGFRFIARTVFATALVSVFIDLLALLGEKYGWFFQGEEKLVGAIFGGIIAGAGLGIVFLGGATTGGLDILARLLKLKFPHFSVGRLILICDFAVVLLSGFVYKSVESILYSIIIVFLSSLAVDYIVAGKDHSKLLFILTDSYEEVTRDIISVCSRGVSVIPAKGGYTGQDKKLLMCVVRTHEVARVRGVVAKYDENPFIIITDSSEVLGQGFKSHNETL